MINFSNDYGMPHGRNENNESVVYLVDINGKYYAEFTVTPEDNLNNVKLSGEELRQIADKLDELNGVNNDNI